VFTIQTALGHPYLLGFGALLMLVGWRAWRWAGRHDLKGLAVDAAWQVAKSRGDLRAQTDLGDKWKELASDPSTSGRARKVAGHAARHVVAQFVGLGGLVGMLGGAGMIAAAFFIK
jgi:hypothetical protein